MAILATLDQVTPIVPALRLLLVPSFACTCAGLLGLTKFLESRRVAHVHLVHQEAQVTQLALPFQDRLPISTD